MRMKLFGSGRRGGKEAPPGNLRERSGGFSEDSVGLNKMTVAVTAACSGAGASFVCGQMLQHGLPDGGTPEGQRTLAEMGKPYFYDALNMARRFESLPDCFIPGGGLPEHSPVQGYLWYVKNPGAEYTAEQLLSAAKSVPGNLVLLDCSDVPEGAFLEKLLALADRVYLVTDPLPTKLLEGRERIMHLQALRPDLRILVNKYNRGVHGGELTRFLGTGNYLVQEMLPPERIYRAEYRSELP